MPEPPVDERRARIRRWVRFMSLDNIVATENESYGECTICGRRIEPGELHFIITFKEAMSVRLDDVCMNIWREETQRPPTGS